MCVVSMVGDHYRDMWQPKPWYPTPTLTAPYTPLPTPVHIQPQTINRAEFDELKRQVEEMKELLKRAKAYDEKNGEPECEMDEKMAVLKRIAAMVCIDLEDVLNGKKKD